MQMKYDHKVRALHTTNTSSNSLSSLYLSVSDSWLNELDPVRSWKNKEKTSHVRKPVPMVRV
jgi:hypothetical protein